MATGHRNPLPKGKLPKIALKQFVPPTEVIVNEHPKLVMEPTIVAPPDAVLPNVNLPNIGDPLAKSVPRRTGRAREVVSETGAAVVSDRAMAPDLVPDRAADSAAEPSVSAAACRSRQCF